MASNLNVVLTAVAQIIDNTSLTTRATAAFGSATLGAAEASYINYLPIAAGGTALSLPAATIWVLVVHSLAGINSAPNGNITVNVTPAGGVAAVAGLVLPNGFWIYYQVAETAGGLTACTLTASVNLTPVELLMAA